MANKTGWLWIAAIAGGALWLSTQQRGRTTRPGVPPGGPPPLAPLAPLAPLDILHPPVTSPVVVVPPVAFPPVFGMPGELRQQPAVGGGPVIGGNRSGGSRGNGVPGDGDIIVTQYRSPPVNRMPGPLKQLGDWSDTFVSNVLDVQQDTRIELDEIWETPFVDRMPGPLGSWSNDDDDDEMEDVEGIEDVEDVEEIEYETEFGYAEDWE